MRRSRIVFVAVIPVVFAFAQPADGQELHVYFGNLHSHTKYSDGEGAPKEAYKYARKEAKLDFLAITDHNHHPKGNSYISDNHELYSGSGPHSIKSAAERFTEDGKFVAIYGQEFSSIDSGNHANVLEADAVIDTDDVPNGQWDKLLDEWLPAHLDSEGKPAILLLNHPANGCPNSIEYGRGSTENWLKKLDSHAQLINIINGPSHGGFSPGSPSESEFLRYLNLGLHVAPTADQDNHKKQWGSAADTRTGVIASSLTKQNILTALRARHVYASQDKNLEVVAKVNGKLMGTIFQGDEIPVDGSELDIEVSLRDADEPWALYTVYVYVDDAGGTEEADFLAQYTATGDGVFTLDGIEYTGGNQYFFLKIMQTDEDAVSKDYVWTAPVWFEPGIDAGGPRGPELTLEVNVFTEEATITNLGDESVNLKNWTLVSVQGDQRRKFEEDLTLEPGESIVIVSGRGAEDDESVDPPRVKWTGDYVWRNSGDPGQLLDSDGLVQAKSL